MPLPVGSTRHPLRRLAWLQSAVLGLALAFAAVAAADGSARPNGATPTAGFTVVSPTRGTIWLRLARALGPAERLLLTDITGRAVPFAALAVAGGVELRPAVPLAAGVYVVTRTDGIGHTSAKVVVLR